MKAAVDRATTARVLAGIDAVLRERTAEAVERVLRTAAPAHGPVVDFELVAFDDSLADELGVSLVRTNCFDHCPRRSEDGTWVTDQRGESLACVDNLTDHATPGMTDTLAYAEYLACEVDRQRKRYAPWVVSPHLFAEAAR